jgi:hypothetical protein
LKDLQAMAPAARMDPVPAKIARWSARQAVPLCAGAVGALWFVAWAGPHVLDPRQIGWLMSGEDWTTHLMGWLFYRNEPLGLPLGEVSGLLHPLGTTVGYTDSLPWLAVLFRLFSGWLPADFQYIGPWLAASFFLMGAVGAWAVRPFTRDPVAQLAAGVLFATSPVLLSRVGHDSLCAHWALVLLLGLHARPAPDLATARRHGWLAVAVVGFTAGVHPYLAVMALGLALALAWKLAWVDRSILWWHGALATLALPALCVAVFALFGYFGGGVSSGHEGFARFNADLLALVNPRGKGRLMPDLPAGVPTFEGYGYLGLGGLGLAVFALTSVLVRRTFRREVPWKRAILAGCVALGFAFFSLGPVVKLGTATLVTLHGLYAPLDAITGPFRSAGRFIWPLHYAVVLGALVVVLRLWRSRPRIATVAVVGACFLQLIDFDLRAGDLFQRRPIDARLHAPVWNELGLEHRHLKLVPAQIAWSGGPCEGELPGHLRWPFAYLAYRQKMTFNGGYVARANREAMFASCAALNDSVRRGELDPETVYVLGPDSLRALRATSSDARCGRVDGYAVCVAAGAHGRVRRALDAHPL